MEVIPVIDLKNAVPVHAIGGRRESYQPVSTQLVKHPSFPHVTLVDLAKGYLDRLMAATVYIADLDAIAGGDPTWEAYSQVAELGLNLWLDIGCRDAATVNRFTVFADSLELDCTLVLPLERIATPDELENLARRAQDDSCQLVFSLDMRAGRPMSAPGWLGATPLEIAKIVASAHLDHVLVLDLAAVGGGAGPSYTGLIGQLCGVPGIRRLAAGGGIRGRADLLKLKKTGCAEALVASAAHHGAITSDDVIAVSGD